MTQAEAYEITRAAVQRAYPAKTVKPETQVYGPQADMDSLDMVGAIVDIEGRVMNETGKRIQVQVGSFGTVTVADLAQHVYELCES
jgi:acyl carrier protein